MASCHDVESNPSSLNDGSVWISTENCTWEPHHLGGRIIVHEARNNNDIQQRSIRTLVL